MLRGKGFSSEKHEQMEEIHGKIINRGHLEAICALAILRLTYGYSKRWPFCQSDCISWLSFELCIQPGCLAVDVAYHNYQ